MKHSYYQVVWFVMFHVNHSNGYRLRAEASWVHSAYFSNLLLTYAQHGQRINLSVCSYTNSEILILTPCKLHFIEPWCILYGALKSPAVERLTLLTLKEESRIEFSCINCYICSIANIIIPIGSEKMHKQCHIATKGTDYVNLKTALLVSN